MNQVVDVLSAYLAWFLTKMKSNKIKLHILCKILGNPYLGMIVHKVILSFVPLGGIQVIFRVFNQDSHDIQCTSKMEHEISNPSSLVNRFSKLFHALLIWYHFFFNFPIKGIRSNLSYTKNQGLQCFFLTVVSQCDFFWFFVGGLFYRTGRKYFGHNSVKEYKFVQRSRKKLFVRLSVKWNEFVHIPSIYPL